MRPPIFEMYSFTLSPYALSIYWLCEDETCSKDFIIQTAKDCLIDGEIDSYEYEVLYGKITKYFNEI